MAPTSCHQQVKALEAESITSDHYKCLASSNKCLISSNKKLLETSASLVVTKCFFVFGQRSRALPDPTEAPVIPETWQASQEPLVALNIVKNYTSIDPKQFQNYSFRPTLVKN